MTPSAQSRRTQPACPSAALSDAIADELRRYDDHLHDVRGLAASTRRNHCRIVGLLLQKKFAGGVIDMARLHAADVQRFIAQQLGDSPSHSAAAQVATALRSYLRYRTICGDSVAGLSAVISSPVQWNLAVLPRALKPDEVQRLLAALPYGRKPRRGYAIVRCALDMGLRAGDVVQLRLDDIDWRSATLSVCGKNRRQTLLPLTQEVGDGIVDYLLHGRPATTSDCMFVRAIAPFRPFRDARGVSDVAKLALRRAGVDVQVRGAAHVLRHSAASSMLRQGASLQEIAAVLRHQSTVSTQIYAKVDVVALRELAQPWPEVLPC